MAFLIALQTPFDNNLTEQENQAALCWKEKLEANRCRSWSQG